MALLRPEGREGARRWRRCFCLRRVEEHGDGGAASPEGRGGARAAEAAVLTSCSTGSGSSAAAPLVCVAVPRPRRWHRGAHEHIPRMCAIELAPWRWRRGERAAEAESAAEAAPPHLLYVLSHRGRGICILVGAQYIILFILYTIFGFRLSGISVG